MSIFKCKMCGGTLEISNNESVATCEYCGTTQTLPKLEDERISNLYDRANHFRRNNEFDKAMGIYEQILNENTTDAEAYWSLVLCRYGIEYVEDPSSHKRIPTVNRAQFTSIFDDDNYKSALQYADGYQKNIYEEEAKEINEIQKGILAISQKEEPFDVFICYKETDANGRRTQDSVIANDLYHQLTNEGFKVFFSRITLEDKLGTAYEPYIFAALNSSKAMIVLGTKPEFFNAVWVKNEWSRYLSLIKNGAKKILIPAYRDMDPYDLPEEFSHLQAQDMSKLGFMQDLIRGIKKILETSTQKQSVIETVVSNDSNKPGIAPLLERVTLFLEDEKWEDANIYCEKILDIDPKNAEAYLGKLMSDLEVPIREELANCEDPFDDNENYSKVLRFGNEKLNNELRGYIDHINERNELEEKTNIYNKAVSKMNSAKDEASYTEASIGFKKIIGFKDADELYNKCIENAEVCRKEAIYQKAKYYMTSKQIYGQNSAIDKLSKIRGYRDADDLILMCERKIEEIKAIEEAERLEEERQAEIKRIKAENTKKIIKKVIIISTPIICVFLIFIAILNNFIIPNMKNNDAYNDAIALMEAGKYKEAIAAFEVIEWYKDSADKITECETAILDGKYTDAIALMEAGKYEEAIAAFEVIEWYKDSADKITECETAILDGKYTDAVALMESGKYEEAIAAFKVIKYYKDSADKITECESAIKKNIVDKFNVPKVGNYVFFGSYEQDNNTKNGKEDIEWRVLDKKDNSVLLISKYALDCKPYNEKYVRTTWETCSLRNWLNEDFLNTAFSSNEQQMIPTVTVSADKNPDYSTDPGKATKDKVFLLSIKEVNKYFNSDSARKCKPTDYAVANGAYVNSDNGNCWWWLRSPGLDQDGAATVDLGGVVYVRGSAVRNDDDAVRPVLWINLDY